MRLFNIQPIGVSQSFGVKVSLYPGEMLVIVDKEHYNKLSEEDRSNLSLRMRYAFDTEAEQQAFMKGTAAHDFTGIDPLDIITNKIEAKENEHSEHYIVEPHHNYLD